MKYFIKIVMIFIDFVPYLLHYTFLHASTWQESLIKTTVISEENSDNHYMKIHAVIICEMLFKKFYKLQNILCVTYVNRYLVPALDRLTTLLALTYEKGKNISEIRRNTPCKRSYKRGNEVQTQIPQFLISWALQQRRSSWVKNEAWFRHFQIFL